MTMLLKELLREVPTLEARGSLDVEISEVRDDSRTVESGDLFVALPGLRVDGRTFIQQAIERGAAAVLHAGDLAEAQTRGAATTIRVADASSALAGIAANRYGRPSASMTLVGVTGTNGKTTTTYLVESVLRRAQRPPGVVGTVDYRFAGRVSPSPFTTPTPLLLHRVMADMRDAGVEVVVIEVSSHALELGRVHGLAFRVAAFTNLTQDHLDLHGSMERYLSAKARLFEQHTSQDGVAVICVDTDSGRALTRRARARVLTVSASTRDADVSARASNVTIEGMDVAIETPTGSIGLRSHLIGDHNLQNLAVAAAIAHALEIDEPTIASGLASVHAVPGRLERVASAAPFAVLVDYAHTPDALHRAIATLRPLCASSLRVVFGCGGDRDRNKRTLMGEAVARGADVAYVTSDNPRTEDPQAIIAMILEGVSAVEGVSPRVIPDRRQAIRTAVADAGPGDVVLIAGKGHENYQILGEKRIHFDDREEARSALEARA